MPNLLDSFSLMAEDSLAERPWSDMDSLFMATLCYNRFGDPVRSREGMTMRELAGAADLSPWAHLPYMKEREELFRRMAAGRRFGNARVSHYVDIVDNELPMQFSAVLVRLEDGPAVVCYRGTDNTLTGWREDLYMSFETPVPGQTAACGYLSLIARDTEAPLILTGHSKGGNLAFYAAVTAPETLRSRILGAWSFDGPGLDDEMVVSPAYIAMEPRLHSVVPQGSIIGVLKTQQERVRRVLSTARGIRQHDVFSWQTEGADFVAADRSSVSSRLTDVTMEAFLKECTPEQRHIVVDAVFDVLDATEARTMTELKSNKKDAVARIAQAAAKMDPKTYQAFLPVAGALLESGALGIRDVVGDSAAASRLKGLGEQLADTPLAGLVRDVQEQAGLRVQRLLQETQESAAPLLRSLTKGATELRDRLTDTMQQAVKPKDGKEPTHGNE